MVTQSKSSWSCDPGYHNCFAPSDHHSDLGFSSHLDRFESSRIHLSEFESEDDSKSSNNFLEVSLLEEIRRLLVETGHC